MIIVVVRAFHLPRADVEFICNVSSGLGLELWRALNDYIAAGDPQPAPPVGDQITVGFNASQEFINCLKQFDDEEGVMRAAVSARARKLSLDPGIIKKLRPWEGGEVRKAPQSSHSRLRQRGRR